MLTKCELFDMRELEVAGDFTFEVDGESFVSLLCLEGGGSVECSGTQLTLKKGESVFVPASSGKVTINGKLKILETRL